MYTIKLLVRASKELKKRILIELWGVVDVRIVKPPYKSEIIMVQLSVLLSKVFVFELELLQLLNCSRKVPKLS